MATISTSGNLYTLGHSVSSGSMDVYIAGSLSASGFLDTDNVVFYHPLDNYTDGIQGDDWIGSAAFGPALISSGIGSASLGGPVISDGENLDIYGVGNWLVPISGDDTRTLFVHPNRNQGIKAQVVSVSGSDLTFGSVDNVAPGTTILNNRGSRQVVHTSGNLYAGVYSLVNDSWISAVTVTVSGNIATFNTINHLEQSGTAFTFAGDTYVSSVPNAVSGGFVFSYYEGNSAPTDNLYVRYGWIDSSGDVYADDPLVIESGGHGRIITLDSDKAVLIYRNLSDNNQDVARIINISGTTLSLESPIDIPGPSQSGIEVGAGINAITKINSSGFLILHRDQDQNTAVFTAYSVSGSTINIESSGSFLPAAATLWTIELTYDEDQSRGLYSFQLQQQSMTAGFFTIDQDYTINIGNNTDYNFSASLDSSDYHTSTWLGDDRFLVYDTDDEYMRIVDEESNSIYSQNSSAYPSAVNSSGLTLGCWINISSASGTIFEVGRDCNIIITSGYISLGSGTAYWNDSEITNFISSIDDDQSHWLMVDFRYQGGNNWKLYTSADGQNWTDHGIQNSGTQGPITTESAPNLSFADQDTDQLLDEIILWKNVEQFNPLELEKLHALGDIYDKRMDQYQETDIILHTSGNAPLFIKGYDINNESNTLFMSAHLPISFSNDLFINGKDDRAIYWAISASGAQIFDDAIQRASFDGSNIQNVIDTDLGYVESLVIDSNNNYMYFGDKETDRIEKSNSNGLDREAIITTGLVGIRGMAISYNLQKLYWTDTDLDVIKRSDLDGSNVETLVSLGAGSILQKIAINDTEGKMYWTDEQVGSPTIKKANLDGTNIQTIISSSMNLPRGITVDSINQKIYWVDATNNSVDRANLDGSGRENITTINGPQAIAIDTLTNKLYVGNVTGKIYRLEFDGSNKIELIDTSGVIRAIDFGVLGGHVPGIYSSNDLFIHGHIESFNSIDLYIKDSVGEEGKPIDWLVKNHDYSPQIIGTINSASGVNIQVWDITNGNNDIVNIQSSGCYRIGDTNNWAWSTSNLPDNIEFSKHYFYIMTGNNNITFDGQFFLKMPENTRWIHPRNRSSYLR